MRKLFCLFLALLLLAGCASPLELIGAAVPLPPEDYVAKEDGFRYYKSLLTSQEQYVYDQLLDGIQNQEEEISGLYPDMELIETAVHALDRDYPELFWFSGSGEVVTTTLGKSSLKAAYRPIYGMDDQARAETQARIDQWTAACFASLPEGASDYDKVAGVYTYIIDHADYGQTDSNSIVNIMINGVGLCGCYAKTTQYLLNLLGVDCAYVTGTAADQSHAWNLVWLENQPYWVDTTWGDPVFSGNGPSDGVSYDYLCVTTEDLARTHTIDPTYPVPVCDSLFYNYYRYNGLYFDTYDTQRLVQVFAAALSRGDTRINLRFDPGIYSMAVDTLFNSGDAFSLLRRARASSLSSLHYTKDDNMNTVTLLLA